MIITWLGQSAFKLQDKVSADGITVVTDPYGKETGLKMPSFEADIVTVSHDHADHNNVDALRGNPFIIDCAGEYDTKGILIEGIDSYHDEEEGKLRGGNIIYRIEIDESIRFINTGETYLTDDVVMQHSVVYATGSDITPTLDKSNSLYDYNLARTISF